MRNRYNIMEQMFLDDRVLEENQFHKDWHVRYAAAVAMGESGEEKWLDSITKLLEIEKTRQLYTQPRVLGFVNSFDDTRMAEQLVPIEPIFDQEYDEKIKEDWACRGRIRQACMAAIGKIGKVNPQLLEEMYRCLEDPDDDYAVKAAAAKTLGDVGSKESLPYLEKALGLDEWCLQTEARKAIRRLEKNE